MMVEYEYIFDISLFQRVLPNGWTLQVMDDNNYSATNGQLRTPWLKSRGIALIHAWALVVEVMQDA